MRAIMFYMEQLATQLVQSSDLGLSSVFLALYLMLFYTLRKDHKEHKEEYRCISNRMLDVVRQNSENNARLAESIKQMHDRLK